MSTFVLSPALILVAYQPVSLSGELQPHPHTGSRSLSERIRLLCRCK